MWRAVAIAAALLLLPVPGTRAAAEESLATKIKRIFATPTPTPRPKKRSTSRRKATPTPTPRRKSTPKPTPGKAADASPTPRRSPSATPSPSPSKKASPTPSASPSPEESPTPKASASPDASPAPTSDASPSASPAKKRASGVAIAPDQIAGFEENPPRVKELLQTALELAGRDLKYKYGSADPDNGGVDCSGFIFYVLKKHGFEEVPRDSSQQYVWVRKAGNFQPVMSRSEESFELEELRPGDLLFWTGTYDIERDPPITHTMIYLGREKKTGDRVMVGASDGRVYRDQSRFGVSVFDFKISRVRRPNVNGRVPMFIGYGRIPGLGDG